MAIVEWKEKFCLGIEQFDEEHQHLVEMINSFYDSCHTEPPVDNLGGFLDSLIDYAAHHLNAEETWMEGHQYLKFAAHKEMHAYFISEIKLLRAGFADENKDISVVTLTLLFHWLRRHILVADADYVRSNVGGGLETGLKPPPKVPAPRWGDHTPER